MRHRVHRTVAAVLLLLAAPSVAAAAAEDVSVQALLDAPEAFSGTEVTVTGELIGDYGRRGGSVWTQLNDDAYARAPLREGGDLAGVNLGIGVRIPDSLAADLDEPGGYVRRGPLVAATGTWIHHDPDRGGESYLDVGDLTLIEPGRVLDEQGLALPRVLAGVALCLAAAALWAGRRRRR